MRVLIFSFFLLPLFGSEDLDYITGCPSCSPVASKKPAPIEKPPEIRYGNPPSFCGEKTVRAFLYGEPFLASVREDGISFAIRSTGSPLQGKFVEPAARWRPGFRVGGGVHFDHDAWEGSVDWTSYRKEISK